MSNIEHVDELRKQASEACLIRVTTHTVGIINSIRVEGYDPVTQRQGDGEEAGTGCAARWGNRHFILTAKHVIHSNAKPSDIRLFWRPTSGIERTADAELKPQDIIDGVPIRDENAAIYRCDWEDLAIIVIDPAQAGPYTEFVDIENDWIDPAEKEVVHCCGFPIDKHILVGSRWVGKKEERGIAIRPDLFSGEVFYYPNFLTDDYAPEKHYLVPYDHPKRPEGFSGAAAWWESDQHKQIWKPDFKFAGVCTHEYKDGTIERLVKASVVRKFLEEVFGTV
ncbi:MAG: hypothetical protein ABSE92_16185 [Terriglobales bacterium]